MGVQCYTIKLTDKAALSVICSLSSKAIRMQNVLGHDDTISQSKGRWLSHGDVPTYYIRYGGNNIIWSVSIIRFLPWKSESWHQNCQCTGIASALNKHSLFTNGSSHLHLANQSYVVHLILLAYLNVAAVRNQIAHVCYPKFLDLYFNSKDIQCQKCF